MKKTATPLMVTLPYVTDHKLTLTIHEAKRLKFIQAGDKFFIRHKRQSFRVNPAVFHAVTDFLASSLARKS